MNAAKVVRRNSLVFWGMWRGSLLFAVMNPLLFLGAIGFGIGALVSRGDPSAFGEAGYLAFFATGMLAATCMQSGAFAATYPFLSKITWQKNYDAMTSTPLGVRDIFLGELAWTALMLAVVAVPFYGVMMIFGIPRSALGLLSIPIALLTGLGFSAAVMAYASTLENDAPFVWFFRFVLTPLFLFSGTFFPLDALPAWVKVVANATPLYHGIELIRGFSLGGLGGAEGVWHLGYLMLFLVLGTKIGIRNLTRRLYS